MSTVLAVEDDPGAALLLRAIFGTGLYEFRMATNFQEVLDILPELTVPLVALVDEDFPGGNGAQVAEILREKIPGVKLISTSANRDESIRWGPDARVRKPLSIIGLLKEVERLMGS